MYKKIFFLKPEHEATSLRWNNFIKPDENFHSFIFLELAILQVKKWSTKNNDDFHRDKIN